jgi:hypothetical protein
VPTSGWDSTTVDHVPVTGERPIRVLWRLAFLDAAPLCGASVRHDVSTTELHRRLERGARVRQWLIGERVKNLFTKDVYGPGPEHST